MRISQFRVAPRLLRGVYLLIPTTLFLLFFIFSGCEKDIIPQPDQGLEQTKVRQSKQTFSREPMTIELAMSIFYSENTETDITESLSSFGRNGDDDCLDVAPIWMLARELTTVTGSEIVIVPLDVSNEEVENGLGIQMVFYTENSGEISAEIVLYKAEAPLASSGISNASEHFPVNNESFTGLVVTIDPFQETQKVFSIENGEIQAVFDLDPSLLIGCSSVEGSRDEFPLLSWFRDWLRRRRIAQSNNFQWGNIQDFFRNLANWFTNGSNGSSGYVHNWEFTPYTSGLPFYGNPSDSGSGGGGISGVANIRDIFDGTFFNGEGRKVVNLIEGLIADNDLFVCTEDLHRDLYQCIASSVASGETTPHPGHAAPADDTQNNGELSISSYIYELNNIASGSNSCLADVIAQYQSSDHDMELGDGSLLCAIAENNTTAMTDEEVFDFIHENDCFNNATGYMHPDCRELLKLANELELDREELDWLNDHPDVVEEISGFSCGIGEPETFEACIEYSFASQLYPEYENVDFEEFYEAWLEEEEGEDLDGTPLTSSEIWGMANEIKQRLLLEYPALQDKINNWFACRVLGPAFESAVQASLANFDLTNTRPDGMVSAIPDGYHTKSFRGTNSELVTPGRHTVTEVKTKFNNPPIFDYSGNPSQFTNYLNFLNTTNQYQGVMPNYLYLVLPAGIEIDESIITSCTAQNVILITSAAEISSWNPNMIRVSNPIALNSDNVNYHPDLASGTLARFFPTNGFRGLFGQFEYDYVDFKAILEEKAAIFEADYLIGNSTEGCPEE